MSSQIASPSPLQDKQMAIAPLETIDFARLLSQDPSELSKLLASCQTHGFFYLDLQGAETRRVLDNQQSVLRVMEKYFDQPLETKMQDDRGSVTHGYKPPGTFSGVVENSRDCYETLKVARAEMMAQAAALPGVVHEKLDLFDSFISGSHFITTTILSCLSSVMGLKGTDRFEQSHRDNAPSNTTLVLLRYPKQKMNGANVGHNKHTDIGSLTLLFSEQWGLQVLSPETNSWSFVEPRPGHAIINVGDSLRFLSGKKLNSCLHRVIPVSESERAHRYSIAYFLRPESEISFEDSDGKKVTAKKWHDDKYVTFTEPHAKQRMSSILTGGMEKSEGISVM